MPFSTHFFQLLIDITLKDKCCYSRLKLRLLLVKPWASDPLGNLELSWPEPPALRPETKLDGDLFPDSTRAWELEQCPIYIKMVVSTECSMDNRCLPVVFRGSILNNWMFSDRPLDYPLDKIMFSDKPSDYPLDKRMSLFGLSIR